MLRKITFSILALFFAAAFSPDASAAGTKSNLKLASLTCRVTSTGYPNYPITGVIRYDAGKDAIVSQGFFSNIMIENPRIEHSFIGRAGIVGDSAVSSAFGWVPYQVAIFLSGAGSIYEPVVHKNISAELLTGYNQLRTAIFPDALLTCDLEVVEGQ